MFIDSETYNVLLSKYRDPQNENIEFCFFNTHYNSSELWLSVYHIHILGSVIVGGP